jgi:branched-chain amino acid transport system ATP-binding protein
MDKLLEISDLKLSLAGPPILHGIDLWVGKDEIVGLVGDNGSGKTMTLRSIVGLEEPEAERLLFQETDLLGIPVHRRVELGLSYCPSEDNVFPRMSVRENLEIGSFLKPDQEEEKLDWICSIFPSLESRMGQRATTLSGGERQMLALGKALLSEPELLLLDEFSLGLSQERAIEFTDKIKDIYSSGVSVLFVEQDFHLAAELAQRDYYMVEGQIAERNSLDRSIAG